jgi:2-keto-4-pentenoate hydratase/2-oxohepta-3-ene-1,7-dioic acid hydratase in catechol pathway
MRWSTYVSPSDGEDRAGLVVDGSVYGLESGRALIEIVAGGNDAMSTLAEQAIARPTEVVKLSDAVLRAPIRRPPSIRDFMCFEEHTVNAMRAFGQSINPDWYEIPVFYFTNPASVQGPRDPVRVFPGSTAFDYELEVAIIIGKAGSDISVDEAASHIAGYCLMADWTARDLQGREVKLGLGPAKGKDGAMSFGPFLVTTDEFPGKGQRKSFNLALSASVNGKEYSRGNLGDIYWSFEQMISYASRGTRLVPGDVLASGTVGSGCIVELRTLYGATSYPWLGASDQVSLTGGILGEIRTCIEPARAVSPLT